MVKIDIKELKIPNVCFSVTSKGDSREKLFKEQREERGFDDSETWDLRVTLAKFLLPRLERFIELSSENVSREKEEKEDLEKLVGSLKLWAGGTAIFLNRRDYNKNLKDFEKLISLFPKMCW